MIITAEIQNMILPSYPNHLIYPDGKIYSLKRNKFLKARYNKDGYLRISIKNVLTGKLDTAMIHHLVGKKYLNFSSNCGYCIDHIDNNKLNNNIHNLQIITPIQNTLKYFYHKVNKNGLPAFIHYTKKNGYTFKIKNLCDRNFETLEEALEFKKKIFTEIFENNIF